MIHLLEAGLVFHEWGAGGAILSSLTVELVTSGDGATARSARMRSRLAFRQNAASRP